MADRPSGNDEGQDQDEPDEVPGREPDAPAPDGAPDGVDPFTAMLTGDPQALVQALRAAGAQDIDAAQVGAMMGQMQQLLNAPGGGGPVNWELANEVARQVVSEHGDPSISTAQRRAVDDALRLADTWLAEHTILPAAGTRSLAWSAAEWVEGSLPVWRRLVEPVAESVSGAIAEAIGRQTPPPLPGTPSADQASGAMRRIGGSVFGLQVGQAIGTLATEVVSGTEVGLPLVDRGAVVLLPAGVAAFGGGLDVPESEVLLYLAVREAARSRLFGHVPWLSTALLGAVEDYARGISIDTDRIESMLRQAPPSDAEGMQQAMADGLFDPENSPSQQATLDRLETMLALLEGWVDVVTNGAASALPHADALREMVRRRRATGGPAEQTFSTLVGLDLRPRRLREAASLWTIIGHELGLDGRDAVWSHPDLLPTQADLDDPLGYTERRAAAKTRDADVDAAIADLLSGGTPDDR
jgi:putative hydrolase